jgi:hypothetical protein
MKPAQREFTRKERQIIKTHRAPLAVQRFLNQIPYNREHGGPTCRSFRNVIRENRAHCLEAAMVAAVILEQHGYPPLLVSIESQDRLDHVLFLFKENGKYGAVARSRDIGLHGRKPLFRTIRDLVMSYFEAYIDKSGRITGYGSTSLEELGNYDWRFSSRNVWRVERLLQDIPHRAIRSSDARYQKAFRKYLKFHEKYPDRSPDYFPDKSRWLR